MSKLKEFYRLKRLGLTAKNAIVKNHAALSTAEKMAIGCLGATLLIAPVYMIGQVALEHRHKLIIKFSSSQTRVAQLTNEQRSLQDKVAKLELVIVGCLNEQGVNINGRWMECIIQESREQNG